MHITLEADYAVRIVGCLATADKRLDSRTISARTGVTLRFSLKILHKLTSSGIVNSYKGAKGGYELARPAKDITLRDVIETVEGVYTFSRCLNPHYACHCDQDSCRFQRVFDEISEVVRDRLASATFVD